MKLPPYGRREALLSEYNRRAFWRLVEEQENGCWLWKGAVCTNGYGQFHVRNGSQSFPILAHRYAWFLVNGILLTSTSELHHAKCEPPTRLCVNPSHTEPITSGDHRRLHGQKRAKTVISVHA